MKAPDLQSPDSKAHFENTVQVQRRLTLIRRNSWSPWVNYIMPMLNGNGPNNGRSNGAARVNGSNETSPLLPDSEAQNGDASHHKRGFWKTVLYIVCCNYVNWLLVCVPAGIIVGAMGLNATAVFVINFLAIIPLAALLSFATEELACHVGETVGGLLNATFGNAVEMIVSIVALTKGEIRIVQASMLGSILSNLLLVLGMSFFFGGLRYPEQTFNSTVASTMSSLMAVATASLIIPAALYATLQDNGIGKDKMKHVLSLSRGTAIVMLILYVMYLVFQLYTHNKMFEEQNTPEDEEPSGHHDPLSVYTSGILLVVVTLAVAACAEYLVDSIDTIVATTSISKTFIGLILIPIVGNAAEHATAVVVAMKNKMDLAIGVAVGSSMQIALLVTPFLVIMGWIIGQPMSLYFQPFETVILFVSVLLTNYLIQDGKSNYLEGAMLMGLYTIIAISFLVLPDTVANKV